MPKESTGDATGPAGVGTETTVTTRRMRVAVPSPSPEPLLGIGADDPPEAAPGILCPLMPSLGLSRDDLRSRPARLKVYRDKLGRESYLGPIALRSTEDDLRNTFDHGHGGLYILLAICADGTQYPGTASRVELEPIPAMWAEYQRLENERLRAIAGGGTPGESEMRSELERLRAEVAALRGEPGGGAQSELREAVTTLARAMALQEQRALTRDGKSAASELVELARGLKELTQPVVTPGASTMDPIAQARGMVAAFKEYSEIMGAGRAPNPAQEKTAMLTAWTQFVDNLLPKAGAFVSVVADEIRGPKAPGAPDGAARALPSAEAATNPSPTKEEDPAIRALLDELNGKLHDPAILPTDIARDFEAAVTSGRVPRWVRSLLLIVSESNLESQLAALGRPEWGREPVRSKFLQTLAALQGRA